MALLDRFRRNQNTEKASVPLPAGANAVTFTQEQIAALQNMGIGGFNPLPRNPITSSIPFGPSMPLTPTAINPVDADGRTKPRRWEYPVAWNVFVTEQRLVPWKVLRASAEQIDILRRLIEVFKSKAASMEWDITLAEYATERIVSEGGNDYLRALQTARNELAPEIARIRDFWAMPDKGNGLAFSDWLNMALEELLVLDALAIYPRKTVGGDIFALEILDGSTIKPLLDDRGMRPQPPYPAYQQILYGFPRSEFIAGDSSESADGEYSSDELVYLIRNRRSWTPYGFSPVERSLPLADIYLRRQQWLRSEFTAGVSPDLFFKTDPEYGGSPELLRAWETIFNDDMSGQTEARRGGKLLPSGIEPIDMSGRSEKFASTLDDYLVKGICGHFGIMPSEIGITPASGLGGAGWQDGEAETAGVIGVGPMLNWLGSMLTEISYSYLGMPRELQFQFSGGKSAQSLADAQRRTVEVAGGMRTLNEARAEIGLSLIDSPMADMPMVEGFPSFVSPQGLIAGTSTVGVDDTGEPVLAPAADALLPVGGFTEDEPAAEEPVEPSDEIKSLVKEEISQFIKWASKGKRSREFTFKHLDAISATALNEAAATGDMQEVRNTVAVVHPF